MLNNIKKRQSGFTIIEVMIVLAIAGLIMLIVFLAVPALQRNSRNTQRKNEVSAILGAVNEWSNNNNGALPPAASQAAALSNAKLNFYTGNVTWAAGAQIALPVASIDKAVIVTGAACGASGATIAGSGRQLAVQYVVETGGVAQPSCTDS
jgi:prepilin-type N-terminal cleavage/methylation domain-containing protein